MRSETSKSIFAKLWNTYAHHILAPRHEMDLSGIETCGMHRKINTGNLFVLFLSISFFSKVNFK